MLEAHVLIVDDDVAIRESMHEFVDMSGYQSSTAVSAEEALDKLKTNTVDVVITDIMLPGMDGLEFTDYIKKNYDIDVIVMTGYSGDYSYEEAISKGASDFVFKPVRFEELLLRLRRVLKERRLTKERVHMLDKLDRTLRYQRPLSLLLLDIDQFKEYNDNHGHLEGDKVLVGLGQVIKTCLRKMDSAYRYGGEEFTVILPETEGEEAATVAERIRAAVEVDKYYPNSGDAPVSSVPTRPCISPKNRAATASPAFLPAGRNRPPRPALAALGNRLPVLCFQDHGADLPAASLPSNAGQPEWLRRRCSGRQGGNYILNCF